MTSITALVPMKGHSERIPNKNVKAFNGEPLNHWILNTLRRTSEIDKVVVNTDSPEIASHARKFDATVIDRPEELQGDFVAMNEILLHDVDQVDADLYVQTHCTNPLLTPSTISTAITAYFEPDCDSLFSVTPLFTRLWDQDSCPINHERNELKRTQDLPPVYEENSNLYLFTKSSIRRRENRIGDQPKMFEIEEPESLDIDEPLDFQLAELVHRKWYGDEPGLGDLEAA